MDLVFILSSTSALIILLSILKMTDLPGDGAFREADLARLAPHFGVSRSHIRNVLAVAESVVFPTREGARNTIFRPMPFLIASFDRFIADSLVQSDLTYTLGLCAGSRGHPAADDHRDAAPSGLGLALPVAPSPRTARGGGGSGRAAPASSAVIGCGEVGERVPDRVECIDSEGRSVSMALPRATVQRSCPSRARAGSR